MVLEEMLRKRAKLLAEARAITAKADEEDRTELGAEEQEKFDRIWADFETVDKRVEEERKILAAEKRLDEPGKATVGGTEPPEDPTGGTEPPEESRQQDSPETRAAFKKFLRGGLSSLSGDESRALEAGTDTSGGYVLTPQQFVANLLKGVENMVFIRAKATKYSMPKAESLGVPSIDTDVSDADWTSELAVGGEDSSLAFGKRELHPHPLAKLIKVSNLLMRSAAINPENIVRDQLVYKFGVTEEKAFLTGSGAQQPLGVFTASALGISTGRDVSAGNLTTSPKFDGLLAAKYALKQGYHRNAAWMFHRDGMLKISQLKDGNGQYIWKESVRVGEPDRILGIPVMMSEYVPNTFTTGLYVGILGDFSFYWIADALDFQVQRLVELYAATNQVGFIARRELDGMPALEEAFVRVKLA